MPSTNKTPNFALNQWLGSDTFARTDFNADNLALDSAMKGLADGLKAIDPLAKNLYNLILQNYYDGKYTGYKKALMFDGFMDYSGVASLSEGLYRGAGNCLTFDNSGYSYYKSVTSPNTEVTSTYLTRTWTPAHCTLASAISFYLYAGSTSATATVTVKNDSGAVIGTATMVGGLPVSQAFRTIVFASPVYFTGGKTYTITVSCTSTIYILRDSVSNYNIYFELTCSPVIRSAGTCVSTAADIGNDYTRAIGWVRYSGGSAGLGLDIGGSTLDFSLVETLPAYTVDGMTACTESFYELDVPSGLSGDTAVRLLLDKDGETNIAVYDYGILFI